MEPKRAVSLRSHGALLVPFLILLATLPSRIARMASSLWMDEAWVANTVLADPWSGMFHGVTWVQTSPPVYLTFVRLVTMLTGPPEWALRSVAWAASAASVPLFYAAVRRAAGRDVALVGTLLLASNYWSIKMAQQLKHYSLDVLTGAMFLWLMARLWRAESAEERHSARMPLIALGAAALWISPPALFWLPAAGLTLAWRGGLRTAALGGAAAAWLGSAWLYYHAIARAAMTDRMLENWRDSMLSGVSPVQAIPAFARNVSNLLLPQSGGPPLLAWASAALVVLAAAGAVRGMVHARRREPGGILVCFGSITPVAAALVASALGVIPVLEQPRIIVWMLPCLILSIAFAMEPALRLAGVAAALPWLCVAAAVASQAVFFRLPESTEHNRPAIEMLKRDSGAGDVIYVQGGVAEAFAHYSRIAKWKPEAAIYRGSAVWPCCARNRAERVTDPSQRDLADDIAAAAAWARGRRLFVYAPSRSHSSLGRSFARVSEIAERAGCRRLRRGDFGQVAVIVFECGG